MGFGLRRGIISSGVLGGDPLTTQFDGTNSLEAADDASLNFSTIDFTLVGWFNTSSNSGVGALMNKRRNGGNSEGYKVEISSTGAVTAAIRPPVSGSAITATSSTGYNDGDWHMLFASYDRSGNMSIGVDLDTLVTASISSIGDIDNTNPFFIAQNRLGSEKYTGNLAAYIVCDSLLTGSDRTELYNSGNPKLFASYSSAITTNAVAAWTLAKNTPSSGQAYIDQSGSNDLTQNDSPIFATPTIEFTA